MKANNSVLDAVRKRFEEKSGLADVPYEVRDREGSSVLVLQVANPSERLFALLEEVRKSIRNRAGRGTACHISKEAGPTHPARSRGKALPQDACRKPQHQQIQLQD